MISFLYAVRQALGHVALLLLVAPAMLISSCKDEQMPGNWAQDVITVDGSVGDWESVPKYLFEEQGTALAVCNDSQNVYLLLRFSDPEWAMPIRRSGLTIWVDADGGKDKDFMIRYRGAPQMKEPRDSSFGRDMPEPVAVLPGDRGRPQGGESTALFTCYIKDRIVENEIAVDGANGPQAASTFNSGYLTYEFCIPLDSPQVLYYGIASAPGHTAGIGFEYGGSDREERRSMGGHMGGMGQGMPSGGPPRGGSGGRGMPPDGAGRGPNRPESLKEQEFWIKVGLVNPTAPVESLNQEQ